MKNKQVKQMIAGVTDCEWVNDTVMADPPVLWPLNGLEFFDEFISEYNKYHRTVSIKAIDYEK